MRFRRSFVRVAVASLVLSIPSVLWAAYTWSVDPSDGATNVDTTPLDFSADVTWTSPDHALNSGSAKASVTPAKGGQYTGTISWSYAYTPGPTQPNGEGSGHFGGFSGDAGDGKVFFQPGLAKGDSVKLTLTAESTVPGTQPGTEKTYSNSKTVTVTSEGP